MLRTPASTPAVFVTRGPGINTASTALACLCAFGCAGAPEPAPLPAADPTVRPGNATPEQEARLREALQLYRTRDEGFAVVRDELAGEPVTAWAMTVWFAVDVARAQRDVRNEKDEWGRIATGDEHPLATYAMAQLQAIAPAAVPCISRELFQRERDRAKQQLGQMLLAEIGAPAVPELERLSRDPRWQVRRAVAVSCGIAAPELPLDDVLQGLMGDGEFAVRSTAARAFVERAAARHGGDRQALDASLKPVFGLLARDPDPFVRMEVARALGKAAAGPAAAAAIRTALVVERDREARGEMAGALGLVTHQQESAAVLIDLLDRHPRSADPVTWGAIQRSLRRMSGLRRDLDAPGWRMFFQEWQPEGGGGDASSGERDR